jgi:branched-chain amino acid transport system substrate-binding protein
MTPYKAFIDDDIFIRVIRRRLKMGTYISESGIRKMLKLFSNVQSVSNFRPTAAAAIYNNFAKNGVVRPDGRMVHDMYLMQVKTPAESKYEWDYYKLVQTIPGDQAYMTKAESKCELWK